MILAIDIGNTNIVIGCIDGKKCLFVERLSTVRTKTELEYAFDVKNVLDIYHMYWIFTTLRGRILRAELYLQWYLRLRLWQSLRLRKY